MSDTPSHSPTIHAFELNCYRCQRQAFADVKAMPDDWARNLSEWEVHCANKLRRRAVCERCRKPLDVTPRWTDVMGQITRPKV